MNEIVLYIIYIILYSTNRGSCETENQISATCYLYPYPHPYLSSLNNAHTYFCNQFDSINYAYLSDITHVNKVYFKQNGTDFWYSEIYYLTVFSHIQTQK